jgi:hypothetical protein
MRRLPPPTLSHRRLLCCLATIALGVTAPAATAGDPAAVSELRRQTPEELDAQFAQGQAAELPVGAFRGTVQLRVDARHPRLRARLAGLAWKGKVFEPGGHFTNQWAGFRAVASQADVGPSWCDGRPCVVLEYPPGSPVFANARDELREIAPGVYLCRFYERCPCPKLQGYFVLVAADACPCGEW